MTTLMIEYDARNEEKERKAIRQNIRQAKQMIEDINKNGSDKYQNMNDFLAQLQKNEL
jgi:hypothetical protein